MYTIFILFILLVTIVYALVQYVNVLRHTDVPIIVPLPRFENANTQTITPPTEIVIENNAHQCHNVLTPCTSHMDCDLCREGLANCQYFDEPAVITLRDSDNVKIEHQIAAGQSYCLALDRDRARSCNPHTGLWVLAQSPTGFSLLCSCLTPGLVTQLSMYNDCDIPVGCQPYGNIADINETPMQCLCDNGYTAGYDAATQTPFCRPVTVRDVAYNEEFFPRAPCNDGFVRLDHPALDDVYRRELRLGDICVVDPCSIDPVSGQVTRGRLMYYNDPETGVELKYCHCPIADNLFAVHSRDPNMLGASSQTVVNTCIRPFNTSLFNLPRVDYKWFWGQSDLRRSDADVVAAVRVDQLSDPRYARILFPFLTSHPDITVNASHFILKFSTAYTPTTFLGPLNQNSLFEQYYALAAKTTEPCFFPGEGRCIVANSQDCIRRHGNAQVWTAENSTGSWCYFSREDEHLRVWSAPSRYRPPGMYPAAMKTNLLFALVFVTNRAYTTVTLVRGHTMTSGNQVENLSQTLATYGNYSV